MKDFFDDAAIFQAAEDTAAEYGVPRCRIIEAALRLVNLSWEDPKTRDQYVEELFLKWQNWGPDGPTEANRKWAYQYAPAASLCGVTTQNIWAAAGVDLPYLYTPYSTRFGSAVAFEYQNAQKVGAWVSATPWRRGTPFPEGGDAMIIGDNTGAFSRGSSPKVQHELNVVAWIDGPRGALMACLDGGQPGIAFRTRALVEVFPGGGDAGELWCSTVNPDGSFSVGADGRPLNGRRAVGYTNVAKLPYKSDAPNCKGGGALGALGTLLIGGAVGLGTLCLLGHCPIDLAQLKKLNPFG